MQTVSAETEPPTQPSSQAVNDLTSPLIDQEDREDAMKYGYSFNSKKVAQGPTFFNLRIMCHCLGKAMKRHIDFSKGSGLMEHNKIYWFLDEL